MKTCFSERKLMKQFGNPLPFLREPFQLTRLSVFSMTPLFVQIIKTRNVQKYKISAPFSVVEAKSHVFNIHIV